MAEVVVGGPNHERAASRPVLYTGATRRRTGSRPAGSRAAAGLLPGHREHRRAGGAVWRWRRARRSGRPMLALRGHRVGAAPRCSSRTHDCIHYSLFPTKTREPSSSARCSRHCSARRSTPSNQHMAHHRQLRHLGGPRRRRLLRPVSVSRPVLCGFSWGRSSAASWSKKIGDYVRGPRAAVGPAEPTALCLQAPGNGGGRRSGSSWRCRAVSAHCSRPASRSRALALSRPQRAAGGHEFLFLVRMRMFLEHGPLDYRSAIISRTTAHGPNHLRPWIERVLLCGS